MKPTFSYSIIIITFLLVSATGNAQNEQLSLNQPVLSTVKTDTISVNDTLKNANPETLNSDTINGKTVKIKKKKKKHSESADEYNPYQLNNSPVKPLPYNSYKEKPKPVVEGTGASMLKDILTSKKQR